MLVDTTNNKFLSQITNALICLFFVLILALNKSYNYSSLLLVIIAISYLFYLKINKKLVIQLDNQTIAFFLSLIFFFLLFLIYFFFRDEKLTVLENPSRYLLTIPIIIYLFNVPVNFTVLLHSIAYGSLFSGLTAIYQKFFQGLDVAFVNQMHIQSGGIAMSIALFTFCIALYFYKMGKTRYFYLYLIFSLIGVAGSFLSSSRGAWIGLPFLLIVILYANRKLFTKKSWVILFAVFSLTAIVIAQPQTGVISRIHIADQEITNYFKNNEGSSSVGARFDMWKGTLIAVGEKPFFGWRQQELDKKRQELAEQGVISEYAASFSHPHNQYLHAISLQGILGLFSLLAIFLTPLIIFFKNLLSSNNQQTRLICLLGAVHIISVMFYCIPQAFFSHNSGNIFYCFALAIFYSVLKTTQDKTA